VQASGTAERDAAIEMAERIEGEKRVTVGADKGYDTRGFVREMRERNVTPHVSENTLRSGGSAIDGRTTRHAGYQVSQRKRKRIEEVFGWLKTVGMLRKTRHRGIFKVGWVFTFAAAAYNLVRMLKKSFAGHGPAPRGMHLVDLRCGAVQPCPAKISARRLFQHPARGYEGHRCNRSSPGS
jgi:hypothetical protein